MPTLLPLVTPPTVANFIARVKAEVTNAGNAKVETQLRQALAHSLSRVSTIRTPWNEAEFAFTSTGGVAEYGTATVGFPVDVVEFDVVEVADGSTYCEVRPATLHDVRHELRAHGASGSQTPSYFCWSVGKLIFAPAFQDARAVRGWYHRDARRDSASGAIIESSPASDGFTNAWLEFGEDLLWAKTLEVYHARFAVDGERMSYYAAQFRQALEGIHREWVRKAGTSIQVEGYF